MNDKKVAVIGWWPAWTTAIDILSKNWFDVTLYNKENINKCKGCAGVSYFDTQNRLLDTTNILWWFIFHTLKGEIEIPAYLNENENMISLYRQGSRVSQSWNLEECLRDNISKDIVIKNDEVLEIEQNKEWWYTIISKESKEDFNSIFLATWVNIWNIILPDNILYKEPEKRLCAVIELAVPEKVKLSFWNKVHMVFPQIKEIMAVSIVPKNNWITIACIFNKDKEMNNSKKTIEIFRKF